MTLSPRNKAVRPYPPKSPLRSDRSPDHGRAGRWLGALWLVVLGGSALSTGLAAQASRPMVVRAQVARPEAGARVLATARSLLVAVEARGGQSRRVEVGVATVIRDAVPSKSETVPAKPRVVSIQFLRN